MTTPNETPTPTITVGGNKYTDLTGDNLVWCLANELIETKYKLAQMTQERDEAKAGSEVFKLNM